MTVGGPADIGVARCLCGVMGVDTPRESMFLIACHCTACQARSGGPFGAGAYFAADAVKRVGMASIYARPTDSGHHLCNHFCPTCGVTVYWTIDRRPDLIGVAYGAFGATPPDAPLYSLYERTRRDWISLDAAAEHRPAGLDS